MTVPKGSLEAYRNNRSWKNIVNIVEAEENTLVDGRLNGIYYTLDPETKTAEVAQYQNYEYYTGEVAIPQTIKQDGVEYTVTGIADYAFEYCPITSVFLPSTIEKIGKNPFTTCEDIYTFVIDAYNPYFVFEDYMLMTADRKKLIAIICPEIVPCSIEMPNTIENIGENTAQVC